MRRLAIPLACLLLAQAACEALPRDAAGAMERIRGGRLRVGVTHRPPWVALDGDRVSGVEPALLREFAARHGAVVEWTSGAETELVEQLHQRDLDVVAAGLQDGTAHEKRLAMTRPYLSRERSILAVTQGESRLLFELDRFLQDLGEDRIREIGAAEGLR